MNSKKFILIAAAFFCCMHTLLADNDIHYSGTDIEVDERRFEHEERLREIQERLDKRGIKVPDHVGYKKDRANLDVDGLEENDLADIDLEDEDAVREYRRSRSKIKYEDRLEELKQRGMGDGGKVNMESLHRDIAQRHSEREERTYNRLVEKAQKAGFDAAELREIEKELLRIKNEQIQAHEDRANAIPNPEKNEYNDDFHEELGRISDKTRELSEARREVEIRIKEKEKENRGYKKIKERRERAREL
mmetsp:Transcript_955/g.1192  ORF Transcript_955/g.1192 Transcript_955/m.1192 type:complete len:248 (+) Transcript_955:1-744(+)